MALLTRKRLCPAPRTGHALVAVWTAQCWMLLATLAMHAEYEAAAVTGSQPDWSACAELWGAIADGLSVMAPLAPVLRVYQAHALTQQLDILSHRLPSPMLVQPPEFSGVQAAHDELCACMLRLQAQREAAAAEAAQRGPLQRGVFAALMPPGGAESHAATTNAFYDLLSKLFIPAAAGTGGADLLEAGEALRYIETVSSLVAANMLQVAADYYSMALQPAPALAAATHAVGVLHVELLPALAVPDSHLAGPFTRQRDGLPFAYHWRDARDLAAQAGSSSAASGSGKGHSGSNGSSMLPAPVATSAGGLSAVTALRECMRTVLLYSLLDTRGQQGVDSAAPFEFDAETAVAVTLERIGVFDTDTSPDIKCRYDSFVTAYTGLERLAEACGLPAAAWLRIVRDMQPVVLPLEAVQALSGSCAPRDFEAYFSEKYQEASAAPVPGKRLLEPDEAAAILAMFFDARILKLHVVGRRCGTLLVSSVAQAAQCSGVNFLCASVSATLRVDCVPTCFHHCHMVSTDTAKDSMMHMSS